MCTWYVVFMVGECVRGMYGGMNVYVVCLVGCMGTWYVWYDECVLRGMYGEINVYVVCMGG